MKKIYFALLICCISFQTTAQDLVAFRNNKGLWGFKNKTGKVVVEPAYTYRPGSFSEGRSIVALTYTLRGVIDETGKKIVPTKYYSISDYKNGFALAVLQKTDTVNKISGTPRQFQLKGILNRNGEEVVPVKYKNIQGDFSNGWFVIADTGSQKKFYYNTKGQLFDPPAGVVLVHDKVNGELFIAHKNYKYGLVDKNFKEILPFEYSSIRVSGHPGLLIVKKGANNGLMNYKLKWVLPPTYQVISIFENGYATFSDTSGLYGVINTSGKVITPPKYQTVYRIPKTSTAYAVVKFPGNDNSGLADLATGKLIIPNSYQFGNYHYEWGLIKISKDGKNGLMDSTGKILFLGDYKDFVTGGRDGMSWIQKDGKYGFMNNQGQIVIPVQYESVLGFSEGMAAVKTGEQWGYINKTGQMVIPVQFKEATSFEGGVARVTDANGKAYYITPDGKEAN